MHYWKRDRGWIKSLRS